MVGFIPAVRRSGRERLLEDRGPHFGYDYPRRCEGLHPSEVEGVLAEHPAVAEVAVVGCPDQVLGEEVAAFVVLRSKAEPRELLAYCRSKLQPDKQPREIFIIDALPRNANGKLV